MSVPRRLTWLLALLAGAVLVSVLGRHLRSGGRSASPVAPLPGMTAEQSRQLMAAVDQIAAREAGAEASVWAPEMLARRLGAVVDQFWDEFNLAGSSERWDLVRRLEIGRVRLPAWARTSLVATGIDTLDPVGRGVDLDAASWRAALQSWQEAGWELRRIELRHNAFSSTNTHSAPGSLYYFSAWLEQPVAHRRLAISGDLTLEWSGADAQGEGGIAGADARRLEAAERSGQLPFVETLFEEVQPPDRSFFIDPVMVNDLDGDGRAEIVLAAANRVYRQAEGAWKGSPLLPAPPGLLFTAALGDFNGDGLTDFLGLKAEGLSLFPGVAGGGFAADERSAWQAPERVRYGQVLATGDADGDGDLDLWLGQYKGPYERGQMPTPYHDANDGYPSYFLVNDGRGRFADATAAAGLAARRHRRTYSASWVDLNSDQRLDLVVVSDFAGVDLYLNAGGGRFTDARGWFPDPLGFGMAHTLADFDRDGRIDLFVTGMHCPTASRLDSMGLKRPGFEALDAFRGRMTQGNRLYFGGRNAFELHPAGSPDGAPRSRLQATSARTGWAWSCPAADFDNDGFMDVYVANGHETRQSVVDYETGFWLRDIYLGNSKDDLTLAAYFGVQFGRTRGQGQSYGGYEANRLLLNQSGGRFRDAGWLWGVALEQDSRNAVAADLDADGRVDLVVTTFETWPQVRQTVRAYRNQLETGGHWIGVRLMPGKGTPAVGATVSVEAGTKRWVQPVVNGDAHRTQSPWTVHSGLGPLEKVDRIRVEWEGGEVELLNPALNRYHTVNLPAHVEGRTP